MSFQMKSWFGLLVNPRLFLSCHVSRSRRGKFSPRPPTFRVERSALAKMPGLLLRGEVPASVRIRLRL